MPRILLLLIMLLPSLVFSQEQVSDIKYYAAYQPTFLIGKVGFAKINGVQYMLQENDSLNIYKLVNGDFISVSTIKKFENKNFAYTEIFRNRSLFPIKENLYYRMFQDGFQIIDILEGMVVKEFDFANEGQINIDEVTLEGENMYLTLRKNGNKEIKLVNVSLGTFETIVLPMDRNYFTQFGDIFPSVLEGKKLYLSNGFTKKDTLIFEAPSGIRFIHNSIIDSSLVIIENNGNLVKLDQNLKIKQLDCLLGNVLNLKGIHLNGNKVIALYPSALHTMQDSVVVLDIENCQIDLTFYLDRTDVFIDHLDFIENENQQTDFTIFGYSGFNRTDGFSKGRFFIINHITNLASEIEDISRVEQQTAFSENGYIYCVGINQAGWNSHAYIVRQDIATSKISKLDPNEKYLTTYVVQGFTDSINKFYFSTNTRQEDPNIWTVSSNNSFTKLKLLDFRQNVGIHFVQNIFLSTEALFFTNQIGIYSVFNDCKLKIPFASVPTVLGFSESTIPVANYENKFAFAEINENNTIFIILDSSMDYIDSFLLTEVISKASLLEMGPFIFFRRSGANKPIEFFDIRNKKINVINDLRNINSNRLTKNINAAVYLESASINNTKNKAYLIDYISSIVSLISIELDEIVDVVPGNDNSFYFIDTRSNSNKIRIRLMTKTGEISEVYTGEGSFNYKIKYIFNTEGQFTFLSFNDKNNKIHCISLDQQNAYAFALDQRLHPTNYFLFRL